MELKSGLLLNLQICDMVSVARIINATLVIPELDRRSFWQDTRYHFSDSYFSFVSKICMVDANVFTCSNCSNFSDVFDDNHFISSLANDIKVIKKLPKELATSTRAVKHFRSWSGIEYYQDEIASMWEDYQVY